MSRARRWVPGTLSAALTAGIVALTILLWPSSLGGATTWVTVTGASMEPTYDLGDLVLARSTGAPAVGDVVVFTVPDGTAAGTLVIHRIVDRRTDGSWVTQGDNRDTADQWRVRDEHVVGTPVLRIPRAGGLAGSGTPVALILGIAVALVLWPRRDEVGPPDRDPAPRAEPVRVTYLPRVTDADLRSAELWVESELIDARLRALLTASTISPTATSRPPASVIAGPGRTRTKPSPGATSTAPATAAMYATPTVPAANIGTRRRHHVAAVATASTSGIAGQDTTNHHGEPAPDHPSRSTTPSRS